MEVLLEFSLLMIFSYVIRCLPKSLPALGLESSCPVVCEVAMPIILFRWYFTCICKCDVIDLHLLLGLAAALNIAPVRKIRDVIELHLFLWFASCTKH